jgi:hypothetical protein
MECAAHLDVMKLDELVEASCTSAASTCSSASWPCSRSSSIGDRRTASNTFTMLFPFPSAATITGAPTARATFTATIRTGVRFSALLRGTQSARRPYVQAPCSASPSSPSGFAARGSCRASCWRARPPSDAAGRACICEASRRAVAATAELRRDRVPLPAGAQAIQDAAHRAAIRHARPSALRALAALRNPAFDALPQRVGNFGERGLNDPCRSRPPPPSNLSTGFDLPF